MIERKDVGRNILLRRGFCVSAFKSLRLDLCRLLAIRIRYCSCYILSDKITNKTFLRSRSISRIHSRSSKQRRKTFLLGVLLFQNSAGQVDQSNEHDKRESILSSESAQCFVMAVSLLTCRSSRLCVAMINFETMNDDRKQLGHPFSFALSLMQTSGGVQQFGSVIPVFFSPYLQCPSEVKNIILVGFETPTLSPASQSNICRRERVARTARSIYDVSQ